MPIPPLCFVLMPFGKKKDPRGGRAIDFDAVYEQGIEPAIRDAGMKPVRADAEITGGIIHKAMFERLLLCDFAVADLTTANANVYYELGVRHAVRPATTLPIFASPHQPLFDLNYLRSMPYKLGKNNRFEARQARGLKKALTKRLRDLREIARTAPAKDSPIFQLLPDYPEPKLSHLKTDLFLEQADYSVKMEQDLRNARRSGKPEEVVRIEESMGPFDAAEASVLIGVYLSYRAVKAWDRMINLYKRMPAAVKRNVMVREQLGLALNRSGRRQDALKVLEAVIKEQGPSAETYGLIGRVYKDLWADARKAANKAAAKGFLDRAIDAYVQGFETDWRDVYPGVNAVTLLHVKGDKGSLQRKAELLPVVRFAALQRLKGPEPDYWDYATLLEVAVLDGDRKAAKQRLAEAVVRIREIWEPETTVNNLNLIREAGRARGVKEAWLDTLIKSLAAAKPQ